MRRSATVAGIVVLVFVGVGIVAAAVGVGPGTGVLAEPADGAASSGANGPTTTDESEEDPAGTWSSSAGTVEPADPPFAFAVTDVTECGTTCRDVTVELTNQQNATAAGVTVTTRLYAGNSTAKDDRIWQGQRNLGTLAAGETYTATERVELSYAEGYAVQRADGWVTIETTVRTDDRTLTFTQRRDVA